MPRGSSPIKVQQWTERLERFTRSGQKVAQFCQDEGVSQPSFYQWKKKLAQQASPESSHSMSLRPSAFQAVEITSPALSPTTVRLANGIEIELGGDLRVVGAVVKQLLQGLDAATPTTGGRSC
jgi:hypothetical protein